jgi:hypothetical protein
MWISEIMVGEGGHKQQKELIEVLKHLWSNMSIWCVQRCHHKLVEQLIKCTIYLLLTMYSILIICGIVYILNQDTIT